MRIFFKYFLLCFICHNSYFVSAQDRSIDSLTAGVKNSKHDTTKVKYLNALSYKFLDTKPDTAIIMGKEALALATKNNFLKGITNANNNLGVFYTVMGNYPLALQHHLNAYKIRVKVGNKKTIAVSAGNIGAVYYEQKLYDKALEYFLIGLNIDEELGNKEGVARHLGNISTIYKSKKNYPDAIKYCEKAMQMNKELNNKKSLAKNFGNLGIIYMDLKNDDKALEYLLQENKIVEELGNTRGLSTNLSNLGQTYFNKQLFKRAEDCYLRSLELAKELGSLDEMRRSHEVLSELCTVQGNYKAAYQHFKEYAILKDSLFNEEKNEAFTRQELNYEFEKKDALAKAEQDKKDAVTAAESKKQKFVLILVSCVLFLVVVFGLFIFRSLRITRKQKTLIEIKNKETEEQKEIIEEKNKDILDSIYYARRIQQSLLPTEKYIARNIKS